MRIKIHIFCCLILTALSIAETSGQVEKSICEIEDSKIIFNLQRGWSAEKQAEVAEQFSIDTLLIQKALSSVDKDFVDFRGEMWKATYPSDDVVRISKSLNSSNASWNYKKDIFKLERVDNFRFRSGPGYPDRNAVTFGVNNLKEKVIIQYLDGNTKFILKGNKRATKVYLSGSFNDWGTIQNPMTRTEDGWETTIKLDSGPYYYKYIVDGEWMSDPDNKHKVQDGFKGYNSVMYRYNYQFVLDSALNAREVALAGSFSNWQSKNLEMAKTSEGWVLPVYLKDGTYAYKFIVDGDWVTDPSNPVVRPDGMGNYNSFIALGDTTYFRLYGHLDAKSVWLAGNFNQWNPNELLMHKTDSGWELPYVLSEGNYEYKFIVDGEWTVDPSNPYKIYHGDYVNSFLSISPNHTFELEGHEKANQVLVSGSFCGWSEENNKMIWKDGKWIFPINLTPGKYLYKFIIDGKWVVDPANPLFESNQFDGENSVLWIEDSRLP